MPRGLPLRESRRGRVIGRIVGRILHRVIRGLVVRPIRGVIVLVAVLAAAALLAAQGLPGGMPSLAEGMPSMPFRTAGSAPSATENYLKGTETYNAEMIWSSLGEEAQARYRSRGGGLQSLQQQMEQARQAGAQLGEITYVGGQPLPDGTSMHFYLVLARVPQSRGEPEYVPYVFTLDRAGKIARVQ